MIPPLLCLLSRIVLGVDVIDAPRTGTVELDYRFVVGEEIVCRTWVEREEATRGQNLSLAVVGRRSHAQARRPREDCDDLRLGMSMRRDVIAPRQFQSKGKHAFSAGVAVEDRRLRAGRHGGRRWSPFDVLRWDHFMLARLLSDGAAWQRCKSEHGYRRNIEKA